MEPTRKLPRLKKNLLFVLPDGWRGEVVDLSAFGMRIQTLVSLARGMEIQGMLVLPTGEKIPLTGEVVWLQPADHETRQPAELGLELLQPPEEYLRALATLFAD